MKVLYIEGLANHIGPESCISVRKDEGEALTGVRTGWVETGGLALLGATTCHQHDVEERYLPIVKPKKLLMKEQYDDIDSPSFTN
jgi:hypothetical protein